MKEIMTNNHLKLDMDNEELDFQEHCKKHFKVKQEDGLSKLRDHFAGLAMAAFISRGAYYCEDTVESSYEYADAMLKQRSL